MHTLAVIIIVQDALLLEFGHREARTLTDFLELAIKFLKNQHNQF